MAVIRKAAADASAKQGGSTSVPFSRVIYENCKRVVNGQLTPFWVGSTLFDKKRAQEYVAGVDKEGEAFVRKNYPSFDNGSRKRLGAPLAEGPVGIPKKIW